MPKRGIPDRWGHYTNPVGNQIPGTRFITFKVPLHPHLCNHLKREERFTPSDLLRLLDDQGRSLGQIIDLTQTNRYYNPTEFLDNNIEHVKIETRGQVVPNQRTCKRFAKTVDRFLEENKENDLLIGVHCTHGINRTGYLVCRYMIDKLDFQPENAIEAFNTARGYDIERENYLGALKNGASDDDHGDEDHSTRDQWHPQGRHNPRDHRDQWHPQGRHNPRDHRDQWHPQGRHKPRDHNNFAPHDHGYQGYTRNRNQGYESHQRPRHGNYNGTFNGYKPGYQGGYNPRYQGGYNPRYQGGHGYSRNPYQTWNNDFPERQFGHQHHYDAPPPPPHLQHRNSSNNQWKGTFDNKSRHSSSSYSWPPMNDRHPRGERSYGRSWSGPSSRGHYGSNSPNGRFNRKFNPYAAYNGQ